MAGKLLSILKSKSFKRKSSVPIGQGRDSSGFGFITLPTDIDRDAYIRGVFESGLVIIITTDNQVLRDVRVPLHILDEMEFPSSIEQIGSMVNWVSVPKTSQVVITGIHLKAEQFYLDNEENIHVRKKELNTASIIETRDLNEPIYSIVVRNEIHETGGHFFKAHNVDKGTSSHLKVNCDGVHEVYGDKESSLKSENLITIQVGSADDEKSVLTIDKAGNFNYIDRHGNSIKIEDGQMTIESPKILHGVNATEAAVLGDTLKAKLEQFLDGIAVLTVPTAMGPSGVPLNVATFTAIKAALDTTLSTKNKIE